MTPVLRAQTTHGPPGPPQDTARHLGRALQAAGRTVAVVDPPADGPDAPTTVLGCLADALLQLRPAASLPARADDRLPFDERLRILADDLFDLSSDGAASLVLEAPARWGADAGRQAHARCEAIRDVLQDSHVELIEHPAASPARLGRLEDSLRQVADGAGIAEDALPLTGRQDDAQVGLLAAAVVSGLSSRPSARRAMTLLAYALIAHDWHPAEWTREVAAEDHLALTAFEALLDESEGLVRLPQPLATALRELHADADPRHEGLRRRLHKLCRSRAVAEQSPRAATEAARLAGTLADPSEALVVAVSSEQLTLAACLQLPRDPAWALKLATAAVDSDPDDGQARRVRAHLLDRAGRQLAEADDLYGQAIDLDPGDLEAHEALVSLRLARADESAARTAWDLARGQLHHAGISPDPGELHLPVATTALARSRVEFARMVLDEVPLDRRTDTWQDYRRHLEGLEAARRDEDVTPADRSRGAWWRGGPLLLADREPSGPLAGWVAARVSDLDADLIELHGAEVDHPPAHDPVPFDAVLTREDYEQACRDDVPYDRLRGRYVELGFYKTEEGEQDEETVIRVHHPVLPVHPRPRLDPARAARPPRA